MLRGTEDQQNRILTMIGAGFLSCLLIVTVVVFLNPFGGSSNDRIAIVIETPYIGQGVVDGTAMIWHGLEVGRVTDVTNIPAGGVRLEAELAVQEVDGLTDSLSIDFRPANYFGVTAVNLIAGTDGAALTNGSVLHKTPRGNFTMQALLSRIGDVSGGVLTTQLIDVIERTTRYTDGLTPLIETMLVVANAVATVQTVPTAQLLANTASLSAGFPPFLDGVVAATEGYVMNEVSTAPDEMFESSVKPSLATISGSLFGAAGHLLNSHADELTPGSQLIGVLADVVPIVVSRTDFAGRSAELRNRLAQAFGDSEGSGLQVRIILDSLPAVAAPLGILGAAATNGGPR